MKKSFLTAAVILLMAVFLSLVSAGCTELERGGMSPIPQNSPTSWEMNPYNFRN